MSASPVFVIFGATGAQGGSVLESVNRSFPGRYRIRAATRDVTSDKAKSLASQHSNVELVRCDLSKPEEVQSVMEGAEVVFAVTNFADPATMKNPERELHQGRSMVDAAVRAGVRLFIWSSLPDADKESNGRLHVPHFTNKHAVEEYARSQAGLQCVFVYASFYMQNFNRALRQQPDGSLLLAMPLSQKGKLTMFDVRDTGRIVAKVLEAPQAWVGKSVGSAAEEFTGQEVVNCVSKAIGRPAHFKSLSEEEFRASTPAGIADELLSMFRYFDECGYYGSKVDPWTAKRSLQVPLTTLQQFLTSDAYTGPK